MSVNQRDAYGWHYPDIVGRFGTTHAIYATNSNLQTGAFATGTTLVRVAVSGSGGHVYFAIGADPVAVDDGSPVIPMGKIEFFAVQPGEKMAFLQPHGGTTMVTVSEVL